MTKPCKYQKSYTGYIIFKLQYSIIKKKILKKAKGGEKSPYLWRNKEKLHLIYPQEPFKQEENAVKYLKLERKSHQPKFYTLPNNPSKVKNKYFLRQRKRKQLFANGFTLK